LNTYVILIVGVLYLCSPFSGVFSSELGNPSGSNEWQYSSGTKSLEGGVNLEGWGIYNGCISSNRIRKIKVLDNYSAMLDLVDGKQVKIRFMKHCEGIKRHGFVYTARNNMFCTHNYSVRVLNTGAHCQVDSLEPYFENEMP